MIDLSKFSCRRERFLAQLGGKAAIIPAASLVTHHADCDYPFRQDSDFWYLTGFDEPDAIALFLPHRAIGEKFILFVRPKEPVLEVWNGFRWGIEGAMSEFGADCAHSINDFSKLLSPYLKGAEAIAFRIGKSSSIEQIVLKAWAQELDNVQRIGIPSIPLVDPSPILHQLRLFKDSFELARMREAVSISAKAHEFVRSKTHPGMNERELQAIIEKYFLDNGARGPGYGSIVASGDNACVLHYTQNNSPLCDGDLVLIDAGCSLHDYYNGDITRTFPVNGHFSNEQRALYEVVLVAQKAALASVVEGTDAEAIHLIAVRLLVEGLVDLGLLKGQVDSLIEQGAYKHLYMHRTGHWLGLDVHDVGAYRLGEYPVPLEPGMVLTVEPGIYVSDRIPVPDGQPSIKDRWKGIGIRIEDDVLVTKDGPEVLSLEAVKDIAELEF